MDMLAPELTTLALCWRIARRDGVVLGFTTHDRPLAVGGLHYASAPGMAPSAIAVTDGLDVDTMEVAGVLSADAITAADLEAGCYDGAAVRLFMVDWTAPDGDRLPLVRGTLGEVTRELAGAGGSFTATMRGPTAAFEAVAVETCSPECRAELGDARCRVDLAPLTMVATLGDDGGGTALSVGGVADLARFAQGRVRVLSGVNAGLAARVAAVDGNQLLLFEPLPAALAPGTRLELREGCDKRFATCCARFANAANFRGEPHVPGSDMLTRFPGV